MAVSSTQSFLVNLTRADSNKVFQQLINSSIPLELLNPAELGGQWLEVEMQTNLTDTNHAKNEIQKQNLEDKELINLLLQKYEKPGFLSFLTDKRIYLKPEEFRQIISNKKHLMELARKLYHVNQLEKELKAINKNKVKENQQVWIGKRTDNIEYLFSSFINESIEKFSVYPADEELEITKPSLQINHLDLHTIVTVTNDIQFFFQEFVSQEDLQENLSFCDQKTFVNNLENTIQSLKEELKVTDQQNLDELIKSIKGLYATMEIEDKNEHFENYIFSPTKESTAKFIFINTPEQFTEKLEKIFNNNKLVYQHIDWNQEIIDWQNSYEIKPFQNIAQSMGTVSKNEVDPSNYIGFFFILFFSIALNDALYGLFIFLFTGYFLYFTKLKSNWKSIFNLFFLAGIGSIGWGALSNSWAGNLFEKTPLNNFLEMFQLINPLKLESQAPINQILINLGGVSPIVVLLGFAAVIGLLQITVGYLLKITNAFKQNDRIDALSEISWVVFVYSGIVLIALNVASSNLAILAAIVTTFGLLGMFVFNHGKGIGGKLLSGLVKVYELIAFFADILSYTRLIAIGLTGAIIAEVINILADLVFESSSPFIGFILAGIILIIGHLFNLVVGLFGAYINPLRLHYVEFLPKFFQARARAFNPLQSELKYVYLD